MELQSYLSTLLENNGASSVVFVSDDPSLVYQEVAKETLMTPKQRSLRLLKQQKSDSSLLVSDAVPPSRPYRRASMDMDNYLDDVDEDGTASNDSYSPQSAQVSQDEQSNENEDATRSPPRVPYRRGSIMATADIKTSCPISPYHIHWNGPELPPMCALPPARPSRRGSCEYMGPSSSLSRVMSASSPMQSPSYQPTHLVEA